MNEITIETFDPSAYQRVPVVNLQTMLVLADALADTKPGGAPAIVHKRGDKLHEAVGMARKELTERLREQVAAIYGAPIVFDGGTDVLWGLFVRRLELHAGYEHPGFDVLISNPELPLGASLAADRERAERARALHKRLFGDRGLSFLRGNFRDQSEATKAILRLIKEDELVDELGELVGASLIEQLYAIQELYEAMVTDQLKGETVVMLNLRDQRNRIGRLIGQYCNSVLDMLDEDQPDTLEVVMKALRPMVALRELLAEAARKGDDGSVEVSVEELSGEGANEGGAEGEAGEPDGDG